MGRQDLAAGKHTLQVRLKPSFKEEQGKKVLDKILYCSDALCISKERFRPNGKFKADAEWQTEADKKAAAQVFKFPAATTAPAERIELPLGGDWQVCRFDEQEVVDRTGPTKTLPEMASAYWMSIPVPGNKFEVKPELRFCHRMVYRTRVEVPAAMAGRSFVLRLPSQSLIASVHVNGRFCGWTKAPFAAWQCDVTRAVRPGQINEVCVVLKDSYYAFSEKKAGKSCRLLFNQPVAWIGMQNWVNQLFDFPIGSFDYGNKSGLLLTPSLIVTGEVYASDVFVKPSVRKRQLGLELTLVNSSPRDRTVQVGNEVRRATDDQTEKTLSTSEVSIPAGGERVVALAEAWEDPRLWWPDDPALYRLVTTIKVDGRPVDVRRTRFGFREWEWSGRQFKLNGVPWQLWADCTANNGGKDPEAAIAQWRASGQNMWRFWGQQFGGLDKQQALDLMDARGIIVRRSGIFDGMGANYLHQLANGKELFDNWIEQLKAWVKEERNHPSILIWSLENEITFINSRNLGLHATVEPEIARAAREVMKLDPTRPVMVDGGHCLVDESLPVNGVHYQESFWRDYPDEAYTLAKAYVAHERPVIAWGKVLWRIVPDRPIFMGESYFVRGNNPAAFSQFAGEGCFAGWGPATRQGAGLLAKMLAEGYRWHGVAAQHFWFGAEDATLHYNSWKPVCVLCRQWNWTFGGGSTITRTLKVCNDTHSGDPIEMAWELRLDGKPVAGRKKTFRLGPGQHEEVEISCPVPEVSKRTAGQFILTCLRGGKEVFRETKTVAVLNPNEGPNPSLTAGQLVVIDPQGSAKARLRSRGIAFTEARDIAEVPAACRVVLVGKDALSARDATDPRWLALAARGMRLLVLEQEHPLHFQALPAVRDPILSGLTVRDVTMESGEQIFPWAGDKYLVDDEFTYVVDLDDIAPFCEFPGTRAGDPAAARAAGPGWSRNTVNGFTSADAWKLIHYMDTNSPTVTMNLPREETVDSIGFVLNTHYAVATKIHVFFDDDPDPVVLVTKPNGERQDFSIKPRKCTRLRIRLAEFDKAGKTTGIDNLWVHAQHPADWPQRVRRLLSIGALVKYPMGKGGVVLNQLRAKPNEAVPVNAQKKQAIAATLLRNLHATFAGGRILTAANLKFHPLPSCVMLAGPGARGNLPAAVKGLKAGCKADGLLFLHTFNRTAEWRRHQPDQPTPILFKYVVHYADGQTADVPVHYGEGADHWVSKEPAGLAGAALAWASPFPGDTSREQAVVYQFSWINPRPEVTIQSIDMLYGPEGSRYGTPALLAITAAEEAK